MEQIGRPSKRSPKSPQPLVKTIGEALETNDPIAALWPSLVATVFTDRDNPLLENLSPPCRALYLLDLIDREVQNGGFDQYFYNTSGKFCSETEKALGEVAARVMLSLFERACTVFPDSYVPKDDTERRQILSTLSEQDRSFLSHLDGEFNNQINSIPEQTNSPENPWFLALQYMKKHATASVAFSTLLD